MVFKCQEDSFLRVFSSLVVSCEKGQLPPKDGSKDAPINGYNVVCEDTVLFPEGGGQPCDRGFINEAPVLNVIRSGAEAVHFVQSDTPLVVGQLVKQTVDWNVRFDHMQQHSGQHLITAVFEQDYQFETTTWYMGADSSFIELDTKTISDQQLHEAEAKINRIISNGCPVSVVNVDGAAQNVDADVTRATRGLPKDHVGAIRIVTFHGIESNMCCGTHVQNLSQLQAVKFLTTEKSKGRLLLHFLVGGRVLRKLSDCYDRELKMNLLLNCGPSSHTDMLQKVKDDLKLAQRTITKLVKELALVEATKINTSTCNHYSLHRKDGLESEYIGAVQRAVTNKEVFLFATTGEEKGLSGKMVLQGRAKDVDALGEVICDLLVGKGAGKNGRFQGKVTNLKAIPACEAKIVEYFANQY